MKVSTLIKIAHIPLIFFLISCGGSESGSGASEKPDNIIVSVDLPENFEVRAGEAFDIQAFGDFTPYHPDIVLTYKWSKTIYYKPLSDLLDDHGGDVLSAVLSLDTDLNFSGSEMITDIAPNLDDGGYIQYSVEIGAEGYIFDLTNINNGSTLYPTSSAYSDFIKVYVVE